MLTEKRVPQLQRGGEDDFQSLARNSKYNLRSDDVLWLMPQKYGYSLSVQGPQRPSQEQSAATQRPSQQSLGQLSTVSHAPCPNHS